MYVPFHFFLSYARDDEISAQRLLSDLCDGGIAVWIDKGGLAPGTPNWERCLKQALTHSYGLILSATPAAANSSFVQAELAYAQFLGIPIVPIWLRGDSWIDSVPMSASQTQYVDLRSDLYHRNLSRLVTRLREIEVERKPRHVLVTDAFDSWYEHRSPKSEALGLGYGAEPYIVIQLDEHPSRRTEINKQRKERAILFDPAAYESLQRFLDDLYSLTLTDRFEPLQYGSRWLLRWQGRARSREDRRQQGINPPRLVAPWEWLEFRNSDSISRVLPYWGRSPLRSHGLVAGSVWSIAEPDHREKYSGTPRECAYGIAVSNNFLMQEIFDGPGKQPHPPHKAGFLELVPYGSINTQAFRHLVVALDQWSGRPFAGRVLRETDKVFDPRLFDEFWTIY